MTQAALPRILFVKQSIHPISTQPLPALWLESSTPSVAYFSLLSDTEYPLVSTESSLCQSTMTSSEVAQKPAQSQQVSSKQPRYAREEKEQSASASASAGVCLYCPQPL